MIDIYDANLRPLGRMERRAAHLAGHWHKAFHCWIVNGQGVGSLLFQHRSPSVPNFADLLDISAAGHLQAGETLAQGIREVGEELGIPVSMDEMHPLGYRVEVVDDALGQRNREYQMVYLHRRDLPLSTYRPRVEEVTGLVWLELPAGLALFSGEREEVTVSGIEWDPAGGEWREVTRHVRRADFVPRIPNYYLTVCIMAERLLESRFPLAIG